MKTNSRNRHMYGRVFALAMTLLLVFGICCPAASADSLLSTYKGDIADAIVAVRENLGSLGDDLAAIQEEVQKREGEQNAAAGGDSSSGTALIDADVVISDVNADLHDNPIEHDITVESDVLNGNSIEHNWQVIVDNSRFNNNNTVISIGGTTASINSSSSSSSGSSSSSSSTAGTTATTTAPKTGDLNNVVLWIAIVGVSALALAATAFFLLRKGKGKKKKK